MVYLWTQTFLTWSQWVPSAHTACRVGPSNRTWLQFSPAPVVKKRGEVSGHKPSRTALPMTWMQAEQHPQNPPFGRYLWRPVFARQSDSGTPAQRTRWQMSGVHCRWATAAATVQQTTNATIR